MTKRKRIFQVQGGDQAAKKHGFKKVFEYDDRFFDFKNELNYVLPEGYHFVEPEDIDAVKIAKLCLYGFDHGDKGEFVNWNKQDTWIYDCMDALSVTRG